MAPIVVWVALGCASGGARRVERASSGDTAAASVSSAELRQGLFRVRFRGVDGRGRIRLTLRSVSAERFQLAASDSFGRRLWSFESDGDASLFLDHRAREYCRLEGDVVVRTVALSELPVRTLPRVLFGELPYSPPQAVDLPTEGEVEYTASDGRPWSARFEDGLVVTWTLWQDGRPLAWWKRDGTGSILSHRDGAQALWRTVADERSQGDLERMAVPADYSVGRCDVNDLP